MMRSTVTLALLLGLASSSFAQDTSKCEAVPENGLCDAWKGQSFFVKFAELDTSNPDFPALFRDVASMDSLNKVAEGLQASNSNSALKTVFNQSYQCANADLSQLQYWTSFHCGWFAQLSSNDCPAQALCQTTCDKTKASLEKIFNDPNQCEQVENAARTQLLSHIAAVCSVASTDNATCVATVASDKLCGFSDSGAAESYCKDSSDSCCTAVSSSSRNLKVIIPAVIGGVVGVILLIVGGVYLARRFKRGKVENTKDIAQTGETMEVVYNFVPNLEDEIYLHIGDLILVQTKFDDGWAYGTNLTTKEEGAFPMACLQGGADPAQEGSQEDMYLPDGNPNTRSRASSMYPSSKMTTYYEN